MPSLCLSVPADMYRLTEKDCWVSVIQDTCKALSCISHELLLLVFDRLQLLKVDLPKDQQVPKYQFERTMSDSVPAVQYPARELQQEQSSNQSAPPLPPRSSAHSHHQHEGLYDDKPLRSGYASTAPPGGTAGEHHQHGIHEFGHHHSEPHEHGHHSLSSFTGGRGLDASNASQHTHDALNK